MIVKLSGQFCRLDVRMVAVHEASIDFSNEVL